MLSEDETAETLDFVPPLVLTGIGLLGFSREGRNFFVRSPSFSEALFFYLPYITNSTPPNPLPPFSLL